MFSAALSLIVILSQAPATDLAEPASNDLEASDVAPAQPADAPPPDAPTAERPLVPAPPSTAPSSSEEDPSAENPATSPQTAPGPPAVDAAASGQETVVTGTRMPRPVRDVPATVVVIPREEIANSPALLIDQVIRAVPSVALFRRSSSLVADPSAQGLNLRGLGPSGVSRALVLLDGVPVTDAFGGWVYWRSLPRLGIERVEISPGGASALYGNAALGGVVQLVSRPVNSPLTGEAEVAVGEFDTVHAAGRVASKTGPVGAALEVEGLTTSGHPVVASYARGPIDRAAPSRHLTANVRLEYGAGTPWHVTLRAGRFLEEQNGGTRFTNASVELSDFALTSRARLPNRHGFEASLFVRNQLFSQERARIIGDREGEARASTQDVPAVDRGFGLLWTLPPLEALGTHRLSVGTDLRFIDGESREVLFPAAVSPSAITSHVAGGEQLFAGLFVEDAVAVGRNLQLSGAVRVDGWRNFGGRSRTENAAGDVEERGFAPRNALQLNPRLGALYRVSDHVALRSSLWRAFRAPTLNELYRPFQVGRVLTAANDALGPETLYGGELGVELAPRDASTLRVTGFWNELFDPVVNVTLAEPIGGAERQRQNLGAARVRGVEVAGDVRLGRAWVLLASYTFVDARVTSAPSQPDLVGKQLPHDPNHRATLAARFESKTIADVTLQARWVGPQFEDDLNERPMAGYVVVDAFAARHLAWKLHVFAAVENLFDREYLVGRAGVDTIGQPFMVRAGLRLIP